MPRPKTRRARKPRLDPVAKTAEAVGLPAIQVANDRFEHCDIVNFTSADSSSTQRNIGQTRSNRDIQDAKRQTVRRMPKVHELVARKVITPSEAAACDWYAAMHSARYDTTGTTAKLGGTGGGMGKRDHLPTTREQQEAYDHFDYARAGINRFLLPMFERVVLHHRPLGRLTRSFRLAIAQLIERIEGRVQL